jgi:hypothetical protein
MQAIFQGAIRSPTKPATIFLAFFQNSDIRFLMWKMVFHIGKTYARSVFALGLLTRNLRENAGAIAVLIRTHSSAEQFAHLADFTIDRLDEILTIIDSK